MLTKQFIKLTYITNSPNTYIKQKLKANRKLFMLKLYYDQIILPTSLLLQLKL